MESIVQYFIQEKKATPVVAELYAKKLCKYKDIQDEFLLWMRQKSYDLPNAVCIEGYTSKKIHELAPFLDGAGVYNFLVALREDPDQAAGIIADSFPRK